MKKKLYMSKQELDKMSCTKVEIKEWEYLAKKRKWRWGEENFIRMMKHMRYLRGILDYDDSGCESPPELIAYDAARRFGVNPITQFLLLNYRVDQFYYLEGKFWEDSALVVEIDGKYSHTSEDDKKADDIKTKDLEKNGIKILRFSGSEVFKDPDKVGQTIADTIKKIENEAEDVVWKEIRDFLGLN